MQAKKYTIEIHDSVLDWTHGFGYKIIEYYIPDLHIFVNRKAIFYSVDEERIPAEFELVELSEQTENDLKALAPLLAVKDIVEKRIRDSLGFESDDDEMEEMEIEDEAMS